MGYRFEQLLGIEPFTIDQIATVEFDSAPRRPWADWALQFAPLLVLLGGTAGFLAEEASPDWPARRQNGRLPAVDRQRS